MKRITCIAAAAWCFCGLLMNAAAFDAFIEMRDGYFYDSAAGEPWVPHGIAYQTWNRPLGVWQTEDQIDYDLDEMVKMGANSVRIDMVWQYIEGEGDNQFVWEKFDYFIDACEQRNLRIFALIGYQWPPDWFPDEWYTQHPPEYDAEGIYHPERWQSDIINYEHPQARAQYAEWIDAVCSRYKDSEAIVGWIVGNEYGYLGLWSGLLDGYDPESEQAFRDWCSNKYANVSSLNAIWGTSLSSFDDISFVEQYRAYGVDGAIWADMVQWREASIADFTALSAAAAKGADTNHLISYSTVGMQWGEEDWRYHAEDRGQITAAAAARGASIDFFSVNNYPWSVLGHESQQGHWGISYTKKVAGVPVLYSETGFTSSETMWPGMNEQRQGPLIRNSLWESLEAGAIGTHIFAWHDRPWITDREKGFGIVYADRVIKPAFWTSRAAFNLMQQVEISELLRGSEDAEPDIAFLWTSANDSQYNRYECEMQQIAGALERLGFEPYFMDLNDLASGVYSNYDLVILPRNMRVEEEVPGFTNSILNFLLKKVIPAGVHVMASADLAGRQDPNGNPRSVYTNELHELFGIDGSDVGGQEAPQRRNHYVSWYWDKIKVTFTNASGALTNGYHYSPSVWKYRDEVEVTDGTLWGWLDSGRNKGFEDHASEVTNWNGTWGDSPDGSVYITNWGSFAYAGTNFVGMWGEAGMWKDFPVVPFGRYTHSMYLRSNSGDPLANGSRARVDIEWYDEDNNYLGAEKSAALETSTPADGWVKYGVDAIAPSNAWTGRRIVRVGPKNLLANGALSGSGDAPSSWYAWNTNSHGADTGTHLASLGNSWAFWWDGGLWQDVTSGFSVGDEVQFGGYLQSPAADALRGGSKHGSIVLEFYDSGDAVVGTPMTGGTVNASSEWSVWQHVQGVSTVPVNAVKARILVRCDDSNSGDGRFYADDIYLRNPDSGSGAVFVDNDALSPALVVKDHGDAKAAIFLYSVGDNMPNSDDDNQPDIGPWKWRYDVIGAVVKDYFGLTPAVSQEGTNAYLCLSEYRTCSDSSTLWQIKNYLYNTNYSDGGDPLTFTITSDLFQDKTVRAFQQATILETNSDGTIELTLEPDGMEMLHVYDPEPGEVVVQLTDAPAVVHPFGDKSYGITVDYDCVGETGLTVKVAFMEVGDNGDGTSNEYYQVLSTNVTGSGQAVFWMWFPDPDLNDSDYISTPDGGTYQIVTWLEDSSSNIVEQSIAQETQLKWGIAPTNALPSTLEKGETVSLGAEWEELYEYLPWENTPLIRNEAFPNRVAIFRSSKTESLFPGQFDRVNEVCDWLESMGYTPGNPLDLRFDNVGVSIPDASNASTRVVVFEDDMESGTNNWTAAGLWHISSARSVSADSSWVYNDGTDYDTGAANSGSLVSDWIDLTNGASASLRFSSWYETEDVGTDWDRKTVLVTTDNTNWTQVLQVSGPSRVWRTEVCDLSAYIGQSIRVKFHFDTTDPIYNTFEGWYVEDVEVSMMSGGTSQGEALADDMESGTNGWIASGLWHIDGSRSASTSHSWGYNDGTDYDTGGHNTGELISSNIDLTGVSGATLSFKSWYETEDTGTTWDRKEVYVSIDGGSSWTRIMRISGPARSWRDMSCDLSAYVGHEILVKFRFDSVDAMYNAYEGWYIDDIAVATVDSDVAPNTVFSDDTESGTNGWAAAGLWHQAADRSDSPSHAWVYNNGSDYDTGAATSGGLETPWINLTHVSSATLKFRSWYETESSGTTWDKKLVYVTTDGTNWQEVAQVSGTMRSWATVIHSLDAFIGQRIRIRFLFDSVDRLYNNYEGWYIDDIEVLADVSGSLFWDDFESGGFASTWTRDAGCANWDAEGSLRAWRIGNDDNIVSAGNSSWSNYVVDADIKYDAQGPYLNDAEIYFRYQDRNNYYKVGIRNFFGFWRLKYTVRVETNFADQGWVYEFAKTNAPQEDTWYNLRIEAVDTNFMVYFDGEQVGSFSDTNFAAGGIALGSKATQLGIWEPQYGYFFIDDDEYSYYSPNEGDLVTKGQPLDLDWGYLQSFYPTLILPGTYVMSDAEVANVSIWLTNGLHCLMATDGGVAMMDEAGSYDLGRVEPLFGMSAGVNTNVTGITNVALSAVDHYVTLDYAAGANLGASGPAKAWTTVDTGEALGVVDNGAQQHPAAICNILTNNPVAPVKVFCFNFGVDTGGQLTNTFSTLAERAFEWLQGEAYKVRFELKYSLDPDVADLDLTLVSMDEWILSGDGVTNLSVEIPDDGIMTGTNLYWVMYVYPWDATNAWTAHGGFFSSGNDGDFNTIGGAGLQLLGATTNAYAGRDWDAWAAYNTAGETLTITYGIKDKGTLCDEDSFSDGAYDGWTVVTNENNNITWGILSNTLKAAVTGAGGYSYLTRNGLDVSNRNITLEYDVYFDGGATNGGVVYRDTTLYVNPQVCGWADADAGLYTNTWIETGRWHHVILKIRDGAYWSSDLYIDGTNPVFVSESIERTNFTSSTLGLLSPYYNGSVRWDNVRVVDEEYSAVWTNVAGISVPTSDVDVTFWPSVPDYDPDWWEHSGSNLDGEYEWFMYFRGTGVHAKAEANVYFAPRLMVEETNFPTEMDPGDTVYVPIEWENLEPTNVPCKLCINLQNPYSAITWTTNVYDITNASGAGSFAVTLPGNITPAADYSWAAYMYSPSSPNPWEERIGSDDTFRFSPAGAAVEPETTITVSSATAENAFGVYNDNGLAVGCEIATWPGYGVFDGNYTGENPPEGSECFLSSNFNYAGWGVYKMSGTFDMSEYSNGTLRFWMKSLSTLKVEMQGPVGTKRSVYISGSGGAWKEVAIPLQQFSGVDFSQMWYLFAVTIETAGGFLIDDVRWTKEPYYIFRDAGIMPHTGSGGTGDDSAVFNEDFADASAPEGDEVLKVTCTNWAEWSVSRTNGLVNMEEYENGSLAFWVKSTEALTVGIEGPEGTNATKQIPATGGAWYEFDIALTNFADVDLDAMHSFFKISAATGTTFYVDDIRWRFGATPDDDSLTLYSDAGIPTNSDIFVWWASQYWAHVSSYAADGGFESSTADGTFPDAGYWDHAIAGGSATGSCTTAAAQSGSKGLRLETGSAVGDYWSMAYQEVDAYAGDVFRAGAAVRQPSGSGWVDGSLAYVAIEFLDAWRGSITTYVSSVTVSSSGAVWTNLSLGDVTAPAVSRYARLELIVEKPSASNGTSVADFDDCYLQQGNSFNGEFSGDATPPEGSKVFRSYCVNWSGWGVFYTNGVTDLSAYSNGYLRFWYKSSGYTRVEIQSVNGTVTNKAMGAYYGPTTNEHGEIAWTYKSIPITNFAGVSLEHIKSPFMLTDPTYDRAFYVDEVKWEMGP